MSLDTYLHLDIPASLDGHSHIPPFLTAAVKCENTMDLFIEDEKKVEQVFILDQPPILVSLKIVVVFLPRLYLDRQQK